MSKIADFADLVIDLVADELDVAKELILSKSRTAETVDARHMAVKLLRTCDIYPSRIAAIFGLSARSVHYVITCFDARLQTNRALRSSYAKIAKQLGNMYEAGMK